MGSVVTKFDTVKKAKHYNLDPSGVECIDIVRHRNFNVGNAIKYLWRLGLKKDRGRKVKAKHIEDLLKAAYYILDEVDRLGGGKHELRKVESEAE